MPNPTPNKTIWRDLHLGGISDSKYSGIPNSIPRLVGWNLHEKPGLLQVNQAMTEATPVSPSDQVDDICKARVVSSDGYIYFFGWSSWKIWRLDPLTKTYILISNDNTVSYSDGGTIGIIGAREYRNAIYFASERTLFHLPLSGPVSVSDPDWLDAADQFRMDVDQTIGGSDGDSYTTTTGVNEGATHKQTFTPTSPYLRSIKVYITAVGTGNVTLEVHDVSDNVVGSKTINHSSVTGGLLEFEFADALPWPYGAGLTSPVYHFHVYSTIGDTHLGTTTASDLETAEAIIYAFSDDNEHPMQDVNDVLYIGDLFNVHQVDQSTGQLVFSRAALDLPVDRIVTALAKQQTNLVIGTKIADGVMRCSVYVWNTSSPDSWSIDDDLDEDGVNAFIPADNNLFLSAGKQGHIYNWDGQTASLLKKIPGNSAGYSPSSRNIINHQATGFFKGLPIFGVSHYNQDSSASAPADEGIYSLGGYDNSYNKVLNLEFPSSPIDGDGYNYLVGMEVGCLAISGQEIFTSWKKTVGSTEYGIDFLDYNNKIAQPFLETRIIQQLDREMITTYQRFLACYETINLDSPSTAILFKQDTNAVGSYTEIEDDDGNTLNVDTDRKIADVRSRIEANFFQLRMEARCTANQSPNISQFQTEFF